jgi:hypothetical protein
MLSTMMRKMTQKLEMVRIGEITEDGNVVEVPHDWFGRLLDLVYEVEEVSDQSKGHVLYSRHRFNQVPVGWILQHM